MKKLFLLIIIIYYFLNTNAQQQIKSTEKVLQVLWSDSSTMEFGTPLVNGGIIIPAYNSKYCYIAESGEKLRYNDATDRETMKKLIIYRYVLYKSNMYNLIVDLQTGKQVFKSIKKDISDFRYPITPMNVLIKGKYAFFSDDRHSLTCVDTLTFKKNWTFSSEVELYDEVIEKDEIAYFGSKNFYYSIDIKTGKELWKIELGEVISNSILDGDLIYVFISGKGIAAIDIAARSLKYITERKGLYLNVKKISKVDDKLYFIDTKFYCINKNSGDLIFVSKNYEPCTATDAYFIYKDYIFTKQSTPTSCTLAALNRVNGYLTHTINEISADSLLYAFLNDTYLFSEPFNNMVFGLTREKFTKGLFYTKIVGVKIIDNELEK